ncbi:hypothetical protein PPEP_a3902 [Pseudoalteromonas peptidolytica F12-50-A1]|uniref:Uncharacterized protein n=1 Tax=Pseudoalteromonas peptidolytica F12-50-A1 TaxID=1315280 RepID=A0A8I0MWS8_9GAMM|nr:hypothetical protein [Pseudoalteromonas peptidolytica F12-50-A1]
MIYILVGGAQMREVEITIPLPLFPKRKLLSRTTALVLLE